jgi:hypothetical protein
MEVSVQEFKNSTVLYDELKDRVEKIASSTS